MIRVECPQCGTRLKGPDSSAGTRIKCPKCSYSIKVPEKIYEPEPIYEDELPPTVDPYADDESPDPYALEGGASPYGDTEPVEERRKPCPVCGEMIVATAAKCRFCGEVFDAKLKKVKKKSKKKKSYDPDDDDLSTTDIVICILCPGIGCIGGVVYMIQGKGKGIKAFGIAIAAAVIWNIIIALKNQN